MTLLSTAWFAVLSWWIFIWVVLPIIAISTVIRTYLSWSRLRHIKGPPLASISSFWLIRHVVGGRMHLDLEEVCKKYGSLARIGPNTLVTSDPNQLRKMLGVRTDYKRSDWYIGMRLDPSRDNVLSERNDEKHNALRAKMAAGYSGKENEGLENTIDRNILALTELIESKYLSDASNCNQFDFGRKAQYFTLDTISDVAFGKAFGFLTTDSDVHEYLETTEHNLPAIILVTVLPWLNGLLQSRLLKSILPSEKDQLGIGKIIGIAKELVGERFGPEKKIQHDMLGSFIRHGLTQSEAESESLVQILAGSDTTATAIRATLLHIISSPRVTSTLLAEISSHSPSTPIHDGEARKMPYLQAVIKEGLRIFPPVTGLMSKEVPSAGDTINDHFIPGGTKIGYCAWGLFRNPEIWGEDASVFRPERWIEGSEEKTREREATLELVFGYGRWQCLGKNIAWIELNKVFVELLRRFDLEIMDPVKPWESFNYGIFVQSEMWLTARKRENIL